MINDCGVFWSEGYQPTYGSVCSGVEAATAAWSPLSWNAQWLAEIEPFPSAVLDYRLPEIVNLGDMTRIKSMILSGEIPAPDILVGGTPCQAFSVAGARKSLEDDRGQLTIEYVRIANAIDDKRSANGDEPCLTVWENVPGVLSTADNAFGCFLAALAGCDEVVEPGPRPEPGKSNKRWSWSKKAGQHAPKWTRSGVIVGPQRTVAWRVLDAQHFGLAQRRKRVFVVSSAREGVDPSEILLEFNGLRRDTPPSREEGQGAPSNVGYGIATSVAKNEKHEALKPQPVSLVKSPDVVCLMTCQGRPSDDIKPRMGLGIGLPTDPQNTLSSAHHHAVALIKSAGFSAGNSANSHGIGYTEEGTPPLRSSSSGTNQVPTIVAEEATGFSTSTSGDGYWREGIHALRARPNDSHENLVALPLNSCCLPIHDKATRHQGGGETRNSDGSGNGLGIGDPLAPSYTLTSGDRHAVLAGSSGQQSLTPWEQQGCRIQGENGVAPTVMSNPAGGMKIEPVLASNAFDQATHKMMPTCEMVVRRLTPVECERLQGFPDNWTLLPYGTHKKVEAEMKAYYEHHFGRTLSEEEVQSFCADGPRYKAIGNSMAVPVMDFIGKRIDQYMRGKKGGACESQNNQRSQ